MEEKTFEIVAPEGYAIDYEKSTSEELIFKPIDKRLIDDAKAKCDGWFI